MRAISVEIILIFGPGVLEKMVFKDISCLRGLFKYESK